MYLLIEYYTSVYLVIEFVQVNPKMESKTEEMALCRQVEQNLAVDAQMKLFLPFDVFTEVCF